MTIKNGLAPCLADLGGSPDSHVEALMGKLECSGDPSLQNALNLVHGYLNLIPSCGYREVLILYSALSACDTEDLHGFTLRLQSWMEKRGQRKKLLKLIEMRQGSDFVLSISAGES